MLCPNCKKELPNDARFCRHCGTPISNSIDYYGNVGCTSCHKPINKDAKFCPYCGASQDVKNKNGISVQKRYITWDVLAGQFAMKIDEQTMSEYRRIRGLYIAPGVHALFFVNGHMVATLESGKYPFESIAGGNDGTPESFLRSVAKHIKNGTNLLLFGSPLGRKNFYTVVLVRTSDLNLNLNFNETTTLGVRSRVKIDASFEIIDFEKFYLNLLVDRKYLSGDDFAGDIKPIFSSTVNGVLKDYSPDNVSDNPELYGKLLLCLNEALKTLCPYIVLKNIIKVTCGNDDFERIKGWKEGTYVGGKELEQKVLRNELLNKCQSAEYEQMPAEARSKSDFEKLMNEVDRENLMNEDTRESFVQLLELEKHLREVKNATEFEKTVNMLGRERYLSVGELELLKKEVDFKLKMQDEEDISLLAITTLRNKITVNREQLSWELERERLVADEKIANEKNEFAWQQERKQKDAELSMKLQNDKNQAEFEVRRKMDEHKMNMLRQAQELREKQLESAHERELALKKQIQDGEYAKSKLALEIQFEEQKLYFGMTPEQILVANPNITPEAAAAMAKKFEAEIAAAEGKKMMEYVQKHNEDLKQIAFEHQKLARDVLENEMRHANEKFEEKQKELDRVHSDSKDYEQRLSKSVDNTASSVSSAVRGTLSGFCHEQIVYCTNCGNAEAYDKAFCSKCNTKLIK